MAKKKVDEAVIETVVDDNKEVEVNLDENNNVVKPIEKKVEEPRYVRPEELQETLRKSNAAFFAEQRKIQQRLDDIAEGLKPKEVTRETPQDEWDVKVQKDWKGTVQELAEVRAREIYKNLRAEEESQRKAIDEQARTSQLLESNKQTVMKRHPELDDATSDKFLIFQDVIAKNPDYKTNPFGPVLAMRDMEEELRSQGKMIDEPTRKIVDNEVNRRARTSATVVPNGNGSQTANKIILTKDEKQYCDDHRIKYESFAATKHKLSTQREIEA